MGHADWSGGCCQEEVGEQTQYVVCTASTTRVYEDDLQSRLSLLLDGVACLHEQMYVEVATMCIERLSQHNDPPNPTYVDVVMETLQFRL